MVVCRIAWCAFAALVALSLSACSPFSSSGGSAGGINNQASETPVNPTPSESGTPPAASPTPTPVAVTTPTPTPRPSNSSNEDICAGSSTTAGTDVSDFDDGTDWSTVQHGGQHFAFIKATEGITLTNPYFIGDWAGTKAAGLFRGAYHFFHPKDDPTEQAQAFLKVMGTLNADDLPPMLDWETSDGESSSVQISRALTWLQLVEAATGKVPVLYVGPDFFNALGNPAEFAKYPLFIANYNVNCPSIPPPWTKWAFWQMDLAPMSGIQSSTADYDEFNGSSSELLQFATTGSY